MFGILRFLIIYLNRDEGEKLMFLMVLNIKGSDVHLKLTINKNFFVMMFIQETIRLRRLLCWSVMLLYLI